ncbi:2-dehydropantoate 2-reductase PanE [Methanobrevibacter ruminantium M1]|uniref:2-dehydropantoate 2-reductase n=1 Tax=Methanobrevibacter ruminantium (strain ATCC 35063 / DSM 1093 / JCM 13430 / OCM 146 / M1) TaxID=634498 RepID=D3E3Q9_METRM|nr:ketopantoate reductase family protein [Methanobrevibacter ruminantium]ADC47170.1 2-dehydropantoate 2-reductase PanE [Methanobrevibacter ruminantium M1]
MNILINGTGAIGIGLGASMISQGANVSFFAREETANAIRKNGIKRTGIFNHYSFGPESFKVYTDYKDIPDNEFDFVLVSSKTIANDDISRKLNEHKSILKEDAKIIIFQNGFANDEPYLRFFPKEQVYCARVITGFKRPERYISEVTVHTEPILLGSLQKDDDGEFIDSRPVSIISKMINDSGIPSETTEELDKFLWAKMLYNCSLNPLGAILNGNYGKLMENEYSVKIMNELIDEIFEVIKASGYRTNWDSPEEYREVFYSKLVPDTYNHRSSTLQDISKRQKTEIDTLNGKVIELGEKYGVDVSVNKTIYNIIKTIESEF